MPITINANSINPLTMMGQKKNALAATSPLTQQEQEKKNNVQNLQARQQALQNSILLLKSSTDGSIGTSEMQEVLQEKLEEITAELKTAKSQEAQTVTHQSVREKFDRYEKSVPETVWKTKSLLLK